MAAKAFVLIETMVGKSKEVAAVIKQLKGVQSIDTVTGLYDVIAAVVGDNLNDIADIVTAKIHPVPGISRTVTCLAI